MADETNPENHAVEAPVVDAPAEVDMTEDASATLTMAEPFEPRRIDLQIDADPRDDTQYDEEEYEELLALYEEWSRGAPINPPREQLMQFSNSVLTEKLLRILNTVN